MSNVGSGLGPMELILIVVIGGVMLTAVAVAIYLAATILSNSARMSGPNFRPCVECKRRISVRAAACPHCGCPANAPA